MQLRVLTLLFILAFILQACSGTKKYAKQASKFEDAGLYEEAANFYFESLRRDRTNIEARVGLKKNGEKVFQEYLDDFSESLKKEEDKKAIFNYKKAESFSKKLEALNIEMEIPSYLQNDFQNLKEGYLARLYNEGKVELGKEDYTKAHSLFKEITDLNPDYQDVKELKKVAFIEPYYQEAIAAYSNDKYIKAYYLLENVYRLDPDYKKTKEIREDCLEKGTYTVAISEIKDVNGGNEGHKIHAALLSNLMKADNPFIRIVDRENMNFIIEQQKFNLSGVVDESSGASSGELLGVKAVISGKFLEGKKIEGKKNVANKNGYEAFQVKRINQATKKEEYVTKYERVNYKEYYQKNEVKLSYQIQLTSLETGEILFSKIINTDNEDEIHFISYEGNYKNLFPQVKGVVDTDRGRKRNLNRLVKARREIASTNDLMNNLMTNSANSLANELIRAIDSHVRN